MIRKTASQIQVYYEIAMSIGNSLDLKGMLRESLSAYLRKLDCSVGAVLTIKENAVENSLIEPLFSIPRNAERNSTYQAALEDICGRLKKSGSWFVRDLPINSSEKGAKKYYHIMELPDYGLLILVKNDLDFEISVLKSLKLLNEKLARACIACLHNKELKKAHDELETEVDKRTLELAEANRKLSVLNQMNVLLNKCRTGKETYKVAEDVCKQIFPVDSGYMLAVNNSLTSLEKVVSWGSFSTGSELVEFDACDAFHLRKERFAESLNGQNLCPRLKSSPGYGSLCVPVIIEREKIWGVFHLSFGGTEHDCSEDEYKRMTDSKHTLAVRMVEQYALFLTNLRLRIIDPLTLLHNRIYIKESLGKEVMQSERAGVIMMDIDHFRHFNETYGSEAGDIVLQKLGQFLKKNVRDKDIVCLYGGGEFTLTMFDLPLTEAAKRAEQLRLGIANDFRVSYNDQILGITASFGIAGFPDHGSDINKVLTAASQALCRAKTGGRNRIVVL